MRGFSIAAGMLSVFLVAGATAADGKAPPLVAAVNPSAAAEQRTVVAYSFHGTLRCATCLLVERGAEEAIRSNFADKLADGSLAWRSVNIRLPENRHFATEYEVASWALVLVEYRGDTPASWRNLALAGELVRADPDAFRRYLTAEVRTFLDSAHEMGGGDQVKRFGLPLAATFGVLLALPFTVSGADLPKPGLAETDGTVSVGSPAPHPRRP